MKKPYFNHERVHSYFGFPPPLSTPTIWSGKLACCHTACIYIFFRFSLVKR
jgi:hypothetical protein